MSTQSQVTTISLADLGTQKEIEFRIQSLRRDLEDETLAFQRKNIEFLIHYYENGGKIPPRGQIMWLLDGKVVDKMPETVFRPSALWAERAALMQMTMVGTMVGTGNSN